MSQPGQALHFSLAGVRCRVEMRVRHPLGSAGNRGNTGNRGNRGNTGNRGSTGSTGNTRNRGSTGNRVFLLSCSWFSSAVLSCPPVSPCPPPGSWQAPGTGGDGCRLQPAPGSHVATSVTSPLGAPQAQGSPVHCLRLNPWICCRFF